MSSLPYAATKDLGPGYQAREAVVTRSPVDMIELDSRVEEELAKYGSPKAFHVALWKQKPDATGCNWDARIERIGGGLGDPNWWGVVPQLRARFNLS